MQYSVVSVPVELDRTVCSRTTAVHAAATFGHDKIISLFHRQKFPGNKLDNHGQTPLGLAKCWGQNECVNLLESIQYVAEKEALKKAKKATLAISEDSESSGNNYILCIYMYFFVLHVHIIVRSWDVTC